MNFNKEELAQNLEVLGEFTGLIIALKDEPEAQQILKAVPEIAAELKPIIKDFNRFLTELNIDSLKQMEEAGIEREYAVGILIRQNQQIKQLAEVTRVKKKQT